MNNLLTICWICHRKVHDRKLWIEVVKQLDNDLVVRFWDGGYGPVH